MSKLALGTRAASTFIRALQFAISALVLGIFSYYLAVIARRAGNPAIPKWEKAVEGMSGIAVIYTAFAVLLTCFLGGITFFAFIAVFLDILLCGTFIAITVLARGGVHKCGSVNNSPIGPGEHLSCQLERVTFIVSIIAAFLFLVSAALQVLLSRAHKREKRYGPSPSNNYTSGYGKQRFWQRKNNKNKNKGLQDAELGAVGAGALAAEDHHHNKKSNRTSMRPSDDTMVTGTTAPVADAYGGPNTKYTEPTLPAHSAGYTQPTAGYASNVNHTAPTHNQNRQNAGVVGSDYSQPTTGYASSTNYAAPSHDYAPQTSGVTGPDVSEMEGGQIGNNGVSQVIHDPNPYAEVHHGGYVHAGSH